MGASSDSERVPRSPRAALADWANDREEWVRQIVAVVLGTDAAMARDSARSVFELFLQENNFTQRSAPRVPPLAEAGDDEQNQPALTLTRLSNVIGVNALVPGQSVEFNAGLTLLFGENAAGKTGYARILKALAGSRSIDEILPDIADTESQLGPSADIEYRLGDQALTHSWRGEEDVEPFNRTLVFDNPAAALHLEEALTYSFRPASLALIDHVNDGIHGVQGEIDDFADRLLRTDFDLHERFDKDSLLYSKIESLGPKTDLNELRQLSSLPGDTPAQKEELRQRVAALEAGLPQLQIALQTRLRRVLIEAESFTSAVGALEVEEYNTCLRRLSELQLDFTQLREQLFAAADLPADPDGTWETFIQAGDQYRQHLESIGKHDEDRCLYGRQPLNDVARRLIERYGDYLDDQIAKDIAVEEERLRQIGSRVLDAPLAEMSSFVEEMRSAEEQDSQVEPELLQLLTRLLENEESIRESLEQKQSLSSEILEEVKRNRALVKPALAKLDTSLEQLKDEVSDQTTLLDDAKTELTELEARLRLKELWPRVEQRVKILRQQAQLTELRTVTSTRLGQLTALSKSLSDEMANRNFQQLFREECRALRAPRVELDFVGRQGQVQRRKAVAGSHRPSEVFSEGEQKVLALSDFLAEARLHGPVGPIVFDDPVSSLDYRRIAEVAMRIADLGPVHNN